MPSITLIPNSPNSADNVVFQVTGSGCVEKSTLINNNPVFIAKIELHGSCFATPPDYGFEYQLGQLPAGQYTIVHQVNSSENNQLFTEQVGLEVLKGEIPILVDVPIFNAFIVILLSATLLFISRRYFQK